VNTLFIYIVYTLCLPPLLYIVSIFYTLCRLYILYILYMLYIIYILYILYKL